MADRGFKRTEGGAGRDPILLPTKRRYRDLPQSEEGNLPLMDGSLQRMDDVDCLPSTCSQGRCDRGEDHPEQGRSGVLAIVLPGYGASCAYRWYEVEGASLLKTSPSLPPDARAGAYNLLLTLRTQAS